MLILDGEAVRASYPMAEAVSVMAEALRSFSSGKVTQPLRSILAPPSEEGVFAMMPCHAEGLGYGFKAIMHNPGNEARGLSTHIGMVTVFDPETGELSAVLDGGAVTAIRTAAVSAVATRELARADAGDLAILGSGTQARTHLEALRLVRDVHRVRVWSRTAERAREFRDWAAAQSVDVEVSATPEEAVRGADLVCTTTASRVPLIPAGLLSPGAHVNAVGASVRGARELAPAAVAGCAVYVDSRESALNESSDIRDPIDEGLMTEKDIRGEIGEVLLGTAEGRTERKEITLFKSLGLAVEDVASGFTIAARARKGGLGVAV
ncbi:ornithine cyclodeaminase family protein [Streptomyces malaysiense]|uniref:Ornithine cyclodeaminase n=1 Tax=Streptomyces malaysiense TaxID=1428626 RepID=A0A1J4PW70_9ACTN|nr:ornithine cyclodeaminase family protein [Streptomyces malaysiense]OIK25173.1 ornithine cyclodeaminase [Streptomyces malaysiense]